MLSGAWATCFCKNFLTKSFKRAICENLDPRNNKHYMISCFSTRERLVINCAATIILIIGGVDSNQTTVPPCYRKALPTGMIAGAGGQFLASPMDRVKIILQVEGTSRSSSPSSPSSPSPSSPRSVRITLIMGTKFGQFWLTKKIAN